ncbi:MAG: hypothetical protein AB9891_15665 [Anaerolineaceae bacterium]
MNKNLKLILISGAVFLSSIFCSQLTPVGEKGTPEPNEVKPTIMETSQKATLPPQIEPTVMEAVVETGAIAGNLNYPSEGIPPLRVVAYRVDSDDWYAVEVTQGDQFIIKDLPPGDYFVVAYLLEKNPGRGDFAGGYSNFVTCGLSVECEDHSLIPVKVEPGKTTPGILPGDWYTPENFFPQDPTIQ